jgi:hypothetical protein
MVKLVKNNTKLNINLQHYNNLRTVIMTIKLWAILFTLMIKYCMNKKHMKSKNFQKIIWLHLSCRIAKKL